MSEVPTSARVLGAIGRGLITAGVVVLLFVAFQLWGTNLQEARAQGDLRDEFDDAVAQARTRLAALSAADGVVIDAGTTAGDAGELPTPTTSTPSPSSPSAPGDDGPTPEVLRLLFPEDGDAVARMEIPTIGVDKIVVNGVQVADLRNGPGHYPSTAPIGTAGNASIAGHRTTYGAPFNRIDELAPGDEIRVTGVLGTFTYRVMEPEVAYPELASTADAVGEGHIIVRPADTWVLGDFGDDRVTLTACHPKLSSRQRIIVAAELVEPPVDGPDIDPEIVATLVGEAADDPELPGEETPTEDPVEEAAEEAAGLDEGLDGERSAIPGAVLWLLAATTIWILTGVLGRQLFTDRLHRVAVRVIGVAPAAVCLWFAFEMIDRALPAG